MADLLSLPVIVTLGIISLVLGAAWLDERKTNNKMYGLNKHFKKTQNDGDSDKWTYR